MMVGVVHRDKRSKEINDTCYAALLAQNVKTKKVKYFQLENASGGLWGGSAKLLSISVNRT